MEKAEIQRRVIELLKNYPRREDIRRVSLFGSHLHGTARPDSDIDLLLELKEPLSMFALVRMERELSEALGRRVELNTPQSLSRYFRSDVMKEAEPFFEAL